MGEKELVGGVINLLAAEVSDVEAKAPAAGQVEFLAVYVDALGGVLFARQSLLRLIQPPQQAGLARPAFPQDQHLRLVKVVHPTGIPLSEVVEDGFAASPDDFGRRDLEGAVLDIDAGASPRVDIPADGQAPADPITQWGEVSDLGVWHI